MAKLMVGYKYYKFLDDDSIEIIRLYRINEDKLIFKDKKNKRIIKTKEELDNEGYSLLTPDGYISFTIAQLMQNAKDVIVSLHRRQDINDTSDSMPYAVCRQSIYDLFSNPFVNDEKTMWVGMSISQDTCPADTPFEMVLSCNSIVSMEMVAIYIDDTLSKILSLVSSYKYDKVLKELATSPKQGVYLGYKETLKELLVDNHFMEDFLRGFNINSVDITIKTINNKLIDEQIIYFENLLKHVLHNVTVVKYSKDIDMSKIKRNYIIVSDKKNMLYIIAYEEGEYINRNYELFTDKRDYMAMKNKGIK